MLLQSIPHTTARTVLLKVKDHVIPLASQLIAKALCRAYEALCDLSPAHTLPLPPVLLQPHGVRTIPPTSPHLRAPAVTSTSGAHVAHSLTSSCVYQCLLSGPLPDRCLKLPPPLLPALPPTFPALFSIIVHPDIILVIHYLLPLKAAGGQGFLSALFTDASPAPRVLGTEATEP